MGMAVCLLCLFSDFASARPDSRARSTTNAITFSLEDVSGVYMPPELSADISFEDANGNNVLEALETGRIIVRLHNRGGSADSVRVSLHQVGDPMRLTFADSVRTIPVMFRTTSVVEFPVSASKDLTTGRSLLEIKVSEPSGFGITSQLIFPTFGYQEAALKLQDVTLSESGANLKVFGDTPDGRVQNGEIVGLSAKLQNVGKGAASGVWWRIFSTDGNVSVLSDKGGSSELVGTLDRLKVGESAGISFRVAVGNDFSTDEEYLPLYISAGGEDMIGIYKESLQIVFDKAPHQAGVVSVEPDLTGLSSLQRNNVAVSSGTFCNAIEARDIVSAPAGVPLSRDVHAFSIGVDKNMYGIVDVPQAANDAGLAASYFKKTLCAGNVRTLTGSGVTGAVLGDIFDIRYGELSKTVARAGSNIYVFYSGPAVCSGDDIFLLPFDARMENVQQRGCSLAVLLSDLNAMGAESVTVLADINCISSEELPAPVHGPWEKNPAFHCIMLLSGKHCQNTGIASRYGLFAYYMAAGLQGEADKDGDGSIRYGEISEYLGSRLSGAYGACAIFQCSGDGKAVFAGIR